MARGAPTVAGTQALRHLTWEHATCVELMSRKDLGEAYQNSFFFSQMVLIFNFLLLMKIP